jgi:hypothetical protein
MRRSDLRCPEPQRPGCDHCAGMPPQSRLVPSQTGSRSSMRGDVAPPRGSSWLPPTTRPDSISPASRDRVWRRVRRGIRQPRHGEQRRLGRIQNRRPSRRPSPTAVLCPTRPTLPTSLVCGRGSARHHLATFGRPARSSLESAQRLHRLGQAVGKTSNYPFGLSQRTKIGSRAGKSGGPRSQEPN